jgi:hypothetical protein
MVYRPRVALNPVVGGTRRHGRGTVRSRGSPHTSSVLDARDQLGAPLEGSASGAMKLVAGARASMRERSRPRARQGYGRPRKRPAATGLTGTGQCGGGNDSEPGGGTTPPFIENIGRCTGRTSTPPVHPWTGSSPRPRRPHPGPDSPDAARSGPFGMGGTAPVGCRGECFTGMPAVTNRR